MRILPKIAAILALALPVVAEDEKPLPDITLSQVQWAEVVNDASFDKDSLEGKVVVVEQWGVNCAPCIASLPELAKLAKRYDNKGLVVVGLERQRSSKEDILRVIKPARVAYPVMAGGHVPVPSNGIPNAAVFGTDGKLVWHGHPADKEFEKAVKTALKSVAKK